MDMELFQTKLESAVIVKKKRGRQKGSINKKPKKIKVKKERKHRESKSNHNKIVKEKILPPLDLSCISEPSDGWQIKYPLIQDRDKLLTMMDVSVNENTSTFFWRFKDLLVTGVRKEIVDKGNEYQFIVANVKTNAIEHRVFGSKVAMLTQMPYSLDNITSERHIRQFVEERY